MLLASVFDTPDLFKHWRLNSALAYFVFSQDSNIYSQLDRDSFCILRVIDTEHNMFAS